MTVVPDRLDIHAADHMDRWVAEADAMRAAGSVGWTDADGGYWVVVDHAAAQAAAKDWRTFSSRHDPTGSDPRARGIGIPPFAFALLLFESDPPRQTRLRLLEIPLFQPSKIRAQLPVIQGHADACLDALAGRHEIDLSRDYAMPVVALTTLALVGIDLAHWRAFTLKLHQGGADPDFDLSADTDRVHAILLDLVRSRRQAPRSDIASALVAGEVQGARLADDEALSMLSALVLGGFDTTVSLICSALTWLDANRGCHADLLGDDALIASAMHEWPRLWPPSLGGGRNLMGTPCRPDGRCAMATGSSCRGRRPTAIRRSSMIPMPCAWTGSTPIVTSASAPVRIAASAWSWRGMRGASRCAMLARFPDFAIRRDGVARYRSKGSVAGWPAMPARLG